MFKFLNLVYIEILELPQPNLTFALIQIKKKIWRSEDDLDSEIQKAFRLINY